MEELSHSLKYVLTPGCTAMVSSKIKRKLWNLVCHTPVIPAVRRMRQEDCSKFEASLDYILLDRPGL